MGEIINKTPFPFKFKMAVDAMTESGYHLEFRLPIKPSNNYKTTVVLNFRFKCTMAIKSATKDFEYF